MSGTASAHSELQHLNATGCVIKVTEEKGRGVYGQLSLPVAVSCYHS